jgi:hypothetical protein
VPLMLWREVLVKMQPWREMNFPKFSDVGPSAR